MSDRTALQNKIKSLSGSIHIRGIKFKNTQQKILSLVDRIKKLECSSLGYQTSKNQVISADVIDLMLYKSTAKLLAKELDLLAALKLELTQARSLEAQVTKEVAGLTKELEKAEASMARLSPVYTFSKGASDERKPKKGPRRT